jgi:hypothetical protein
MIPSGHTYVIDGRPWAAEDTAKFHRGGYTGIRYTVGEEVTLDFLASLPDLRSVEISGPVRDESPVFALPELESLVLNTRSGKPLDLSRLGRLSYLACTDRPGLEGVAGLTGLRHLSVWSFARQELSWLGAKPRLDFLRLEGRKQRLDLTGLGDCPKLRELAILGTTVESLAALAGLTGLTLVQLTGTGEAAHEPWDLSALTGAQQLAWLRFPGSGPVLSLAPLRQLGGLRAVCIGLDVVDGDMSPLIDLPGKVNVVSFGNRPHYSHRSAEVQLARLSIMRYADTGGAHGESRPG